MASYQGFKREWSAHPSIKGFTSLPVGSDLHVGGFYKSRPRRLRFKTPFANGFGYGGCCGSCKRRTSSVPWFRKLHVSFLYLFRKLRCLYTCLPGFGLCQRSVRTSKGTSNFSGWELSGSLVKSSHGLLCLPAKGKARPNPLGSSLMDHVSLTSFSPTIRYTCHWSGVSSTPRKVTPISGMMRAGPS